MNAAPPERSATAALDRETENALYTYWNAQMEAEGEVFSWLLTHFEHHLDSEAVLGLSVMQARTFVTREHPGGWAGYVREFAGVDFDDHVIELFETHFYSEYRHEFPLQPELTPPNSWYEYQFPSVPTATTVTAARTWLLNSDGGPHGRGFAHDVLAALHDWQVADLLDRHYDGGWQAFALDTAPHPLSTLPTRAEGPTR